MFYPLVSVIIPVYQAEKFLTECVESVRKQDYSELEIVLVNDGSTDRSNQMCEELAAADPRIRVIHQNNKGSGAARNAGIKEATGKYLLFLDADDKLDDSSAIRSLAARAEREQADIVIGTYRRWRANGEKVKCCSNLEKENPDSAEFRFHGFFQKGTLSYDWGKLYRKSFLESHDLWIPPYSYAEDKAHNFRCCACHPKYAFVPQSIVLYRENLQSLTYQPKKNLMRNWILIASDFEQFLKEKASFQRIWRSDFLSSAHWCNVSCQRRNDISREKNSCRGEDIKAIQQKPVCRTKTDTKRVHSLYKAD